MRDPGPQSRRVQGTSLRVTAVLLLVATLSHGAAAHSLFLKLQSYFLSPEVSTSIALVNGTFDRSDNVIDRDRMADVSIVGPEAEVTQPDLSDWREEGTTTWLDFRTGPAGTYTVAVSTKARTIDQSAEDFNRYLRHDGVLDVLEQRERNGELDRPVRESYAKHVKAVVQVGDTRSGAFDTVLGYPVEIVALRNPYGLSPGDSLPVRVLTHGQPLANQLVYASHAEFHSHVEDGSHLEAFAGRTDASGEVTIPLDRSGRWYVRLIHMTVAEESDLEYRSEWATLTFEIDAPRRRVQSLLPIAGVTALLLASVVLLVRRRRPRV